MQITKALKIKPYYNILISFLLIVAILLSTAIYTFNKISSVYLGTKNQYKIIDLMTNDVSTFFNQESSLSKLKSFYTELNDRWGLSYYVVSKQPVFITDNPFPIEYALGYGDFLKEYFDPEAFFSYQLNNAAVNGFKLSTYIGNLFSENDFLFSENGYLPVMVGYDYRHILSVGDVFVIEYLNIEFECSVTGILEEASKIDENISLDRCIVLPALEYDIPINDNKIISFFKKAYLNHTNGMIISEEKPITVQRFLDDACKKCDLPPYILLGMPQIKIGNLGIANSILFIKMLINIFFISLIIFCNLIYWQKIKPALIRNLLCDKVNQIKFIIGMYLDVLIWIVIVSFIVYNFLIDFCKMLKLPLNAELFLIVAISAAALLLIPLYAVFRTIKFSKNNFNSESLAEPAHSATENA